MTFICSSKDTDKKRRDEKTSESGRSDWRSDKKRKIESEPVKKDEVKRHLVMAFVSFIDRELNNEAESQTEEFRGLVEAAKTALSTAYNLPEDDSLSVPRNLEDIFFRDVRNDIRLERMTVKQEEREETGDCEDDDGNWKRRGRGRQERENMSKGVGGDRSRIS